MRDIPNVSLHPESTRSDHPHSALCFCVATQRLYPLTPHSEMADPAAFLRRRVPHPPLTARLIFTPRLSEGSCHSLCSSAEVRLGAKLPEQKVEQVIKPKYKEATGEPGVMLEINESREPGPRRPPWATRTSHQAIQTEESGRPTALRQVHTAGSSHTELHSFD